MENYSLPLLADSTQYNNSSNGITNNNMNMIHHKDHMLAAGSTPSTSGFMYNTTQPVSKCDMSLHKSDYSAFTTCIQQSALLDHRSSIDPNLDGGVSLGALCDLKFPNAPASILTDSNTNFKGLSPPLNNLETNHIMSGLQKLNTTMGSVNGPSFSNISYARDATATNATQSTHFMSLNNEVQNTAEAINHQHQSQQHQQHQNHNQLHQHQQQHLQQQQQPHHLHQTQHQQQQQNYLPNPTISTSSDAHNRQISPTHERVPRVITPENNQHYDLTNSASTLVPHNLKSYQTVLNEQLITNAKIISTTETHATSSNTANGNANISCTSQNSTSTITTRPTSSSPTSQNSIQETAASSRTPPSSIATTQNTPLTTNGNNIATATSLSSAATSATTVPLLMNSNGTNNTQTTQQQPQQRQQHTEARIPSRDKTTTTLDNLCPRNLLRSPTQQQTSQQQQHQLQHHEQQMLHNFTGYSSDSNNSNSSSNDYMDLEISERAGYQDTTSSHSQHSANGGGNGNGPSSNQNTSNPSAGVSLINGVVTLNSGQNAALTGGSNNGGSSASSASGTYMSLLPPNVGAGSSSTAHLGGVNSMGASGTSASASGSTPDVIDFKHLFEELCPVCGDKVSGYHYGLLTCESCKGFFKRTVQNKKVYTCVAERSCHIDKTQRKRCPYCRFQKCLEVGMKLEAVRADRMRGGRNKFGPMYKRDRARKLQVMRQRQLALQALRTSITTGEIKPTPLSPGYQQGYTNMNIKQEIQIPQVSSLTQSPDSSPSPIAIALGQVNANSGVIAAPMNGSSGAGGNSGAGGGGGGGGNNVNNNNNTSDGINRVGSGSGGGSGNCHETGTGSLQNNASESKMCFDTGTHPSSTADSIIEPLRVSPMIREFVQSIDDREWQTQLFALLQKQTYNQVEVDLFELMCKVLDQNLFSQVDWARNTVFFKDLKVDDQMKLLQHSWSDMLVLDHLHQRIHNGLPDETQLNNGQVFNLLSLGLLGVPQLADYFNELQNKLQDLKFDMGDYVCMKFLILLNPDVRGIINKKTVLQGHENVQAALLDYTLTCYPSVTDKFRRLLIILPEIHAMATRGEEHLYSKHCAGSAPTQTLLMEMLHAKRKV